jgi:hypothetical protein
MSGLLTAFLAEVTLITYRCYHTNNFTTGLGAPPLGAPIPATYTAPILVYGTLGLFSGRAAPVAGLVGWGLVVATFLNLWNTGPNLSTGPVKVSQPNLPKPATLSG